jgi:rod shape-determining protein MreD
MAVASAIGPQPILLPVRGSTIALSFVGALLLNFIPWRDVTLAPDFVALVLAFWCVRQPRIVGLGVGWLLGLLTDAGNGVLLGQHALAYSLLAFGAIALSRRILWFSVFVQMLHVGLLLVLAQAVALLVRLAAGAEFPGWAIFTGPLVGTLLWPLVTFVLLAPQKRAPEPDAARPL